MPTIHHLFAGSVCLLALAAGTAVVLALRLRKLQVRHDRLKRGYLEKTRQVDRFLAGHTARPLGPAEASW